MPVGIDFGSDGSVVAVGERGGVEVCLNSASARRTPSTLVLGHEPLRRLMGELVGNEARGARVNSVLRYLLGDAATAAAVGSIATPTHGIVEAARFLEDNREQVGAMFLRHLGAMSARHTKETGGAFAAIAVPPGATWEQRSCVLDAAAVASLPACCIDTASCLCVAYGLLRLPSLLTVEIEEPERVRAADGAVRPVVAICDVGFHATTVSIVEYEVPRDTVRGMPASCRLLGQCTAEGCGTAALDEAAFRVISRSAGAMQRITPRARSRLWREAQRAKTVLSANRETRWHVEALQDGEDRDGMLTRDALEAEAADVADSIATVARTAREMAAGALSREKGVEEWRFFAAEVVGGGAAVPLVQRSLSAGLGLSGEGSLRRSLNPFEAVAGGAVLYAARKAGGSARLRRFELTSQLPLETAFEWSVSGRSHGEVLRTGTFRVDAGASVPYRAELVETFEAPELGALLRVRAWQGNASFSWEADIHAAGTAELRFTAGLDEETFPWLQGASVNGEGIDLVAKQFPNRFGRLAFSSEASRGDGAERLEIARIAEEKWEQAAVEANLAEEVRNALEAKVYALSEYLEGANEDLLRHFASALESAELPRHGGPASERESIPQVIRASFEAPRISSTAGESGGTHALESLVRYLSPREAGDVRDELRLAQATMDGPVDAEDNRDQNSSEALSRHLAVLEKAEDLCREREQSWSASLAAFQSVARAASIACQACDDEQSTGPLQRSGSALHSALSLALQECARWLEEPWRGVPRALAPAALATLSREHLDASLESFEEWLSGLG